MCFFPPLLKARYKERGTVIAEDQIVQVSSGDRISLFFFWSSYDDIPPLFCTVNCLCFICQMSKQLETFKSNLEEFASKHKQEIRKNSQFRVQFQEMCATIGVDPLACEKHFLNCEIVKAERTC